MHWHRSSWLIAVLLFFEAVLSPASMAAAQPKETAQPAVSFWQGSEAFAKGPLLLNRMESNAYQVYAVRRDAPGGVELHALDTDLILVLDGAGTFVTEGTVVDERSIRDNEMTGSGIRDGQSRRLEKGDVIVVPNGTPHWFREVSPFIRYFAVKLRQAGPRSGVPAPAQYWKGPDAFTKGGPLFDAKEGRFTRVYALRRDKPLGVELHAVDTDIVFVVAGSGTFVTGGSISQQRELGPTESTGTEIRNGEPRRIGAGDVLVMPSGIPHWLQAIDGTLDFFAVKVR